MATEQDHVWAMLDDMQAFLSGYGVPTPKRTYKLDGGWTLAMDDLRRLVARLVVERDQLKSKVNSSGEGGAVTPIAELCNTYNHATCPLESRTDEELASNAEVARQAMAQLRQQRDEWHELSNGMAWPNKRDF